MNRSKLALKLFNPDENGFSRWVRKDECVGEFAPLYTTNGNHWYRNNSLKKYVFEKGVDEDGTIMWRFNGLVSYKIPLRVVKKGIRDYYKNKPCSHTGQKSTINNLVELDHKNGRYTGIEVFEIDKQRIEDFQTLSRQSNLQKRTDCLNCKNTNKRFDAKEFGFSISFVEGDENYDENLGCKGCYWNDCSLFKEKLTYVK